MTNRAPLSQVEKERIYRGKLAGYTLPELAAEVGCSVGCARKWWRVGRDKGLEGLRSPRRTRGKTGTLSQFDPRIAEAALTLKKAHPRWGAKRVLVELKADPSLRGLRLPGRSRLADFFQEKCPNCIAARRSHFGRLKRGPAATCVHELWQLDNQEGVRLNNREVATICSVRDPVGAAMIVSRAFSVGTKRRWRKLEWTETRDVLRDAYTEWQTLPDGIQTDNELGLAGASNDPFPGKLTLWLAGLGVTHRFSRPGRPTDQPHIERSHRTLGDWTADEEGMKDLAHLQQRLDHERYVHNHLYPSQASDCAGHPPLIAHPELLSPRRPYQPGLELELFDLQRAYGYLAQFTFKRKVSAAARVSLGRQSYTLGKKLVREHQLKTVLVRFDQVHAGWSFFTPEDEEIISLPVKGLDVQDLTGLNLAIERPARPVQLAFAIFGA